MKQQIEKQLAGRLKILGCILLVFSVGALLYNLIPISDEVDQLDEQIAIELKEPAPLNPFFVSAIFSIVGTSCLLISWKKRKRLFSSSTQNDDPE